MLLYTPVQYSHIVIITILVTSIQRIERIIKQQLAVVILLIGASITN